MASTLLLKGADGGAEDRWELQGPDEEALTAACRHLVAHTADPDVAALVHERDGEPIAAWDAEGAARLAELLPPAYAELANEIARRHR